MAPPPTSGRAVLFSPHRRSTDPKPLEIEPAQADASFVAPTLNMPWVYELRLRSIAYGTEQIAFYYETIELFPILKSWLQYHSCTDIVADGPYVTFKQVRAATLLESRVAVGNYLLIVAGGPLKGTVQPGDATDVARLYRIVDRTMFTGQWVDDPEQLLLQATDDMTQRLLRRLIAAEGLLTRAGHEEWCEPATEDIESCPCGYNELVKAWCDVSGADPEQHLRRWQTSVQLAAPAGPQLNGHQPSARDTATEASFEDLDPALQPPA